MAQFVKAAKVNEVPKGTPKKITVEGKTIALFHVNGEFYALDNTCIHQGGPLSEGLLDGKVVTCPWHAWKYDITTGVSPVNPNAKVQTFPVKVDGDDLLVEI